LDPLKPSRADYRIIKKLMDSAFSGKVLHTVDGYDMVVRVFARAHGSWERLFLGSSSDLGLLKKILKVAFKKGYLPKAPQWR
jgi:CMP-2-keto-3-deoxyoctulosonic acid synthetase